MADRAGAPLLTKHVDDVLVDLSMGFLPPEGHDLVHAHLGECPPCARRYADLSATSAAISLALPPVRPDASLRARLLASVSHLERFTPFAPRLAALADLSRSEARRALHVFAKPEKMPETGLPGFRASPLPTGPRLSKATAVLASLSPGAGVPRHRHLGEERVLVFQGAFETDDGRVVRAGEEAHCEAGTSHAIRPVAGDEPCFCAIINDLGVEFL
jgi:putative transcriptional regulator